MKRSKTAVRALRVGEAAWAFAAFAAAALIFTGGCENKTEVVLDSPAITSVTPGIAASGDTITITGKGFNRIPANNRIIVSACDDPAGDWEPSDDLGGGCRRVSTAFAGTTTELRALVPDGAFSGYLRVENSGILPAFSPVGIPAAIVPSDWHPFDVFLNPGDVAKVLFSGTSYDYSIDTEGADDYLLILFNSGWPSYDNDTFLYSVAIDVGGLRVEGDDGEKDTGAGEAAPGLLGRYDLGAKLRRETGEYLRLISGRRPEPSAEEAVMPPIFGVGAAPASVDFDVYSDPYGSNTDPSSYTVVTADLKYEGTSTLLYVDQNTLPTQLSDLEAQEIGMAFEESIHPTNRGAFGNESDINHDGKVVILLSPVINAMPCSGCVILGFFNPTDLLPGMVNPACTNGMEIFYTLVPDPSLGGSDWKERSMEAIKSTLAHEFQHMILYNYRVLVYGEGLTAVYMEELWLNEGLSHMAEDLNGYYAENIARANLFLDVPSSTRLTFQSDDNLENRGAAYLFLRLLVDRFGEGICRSLVQSHYTGTTNVQRAAGLGFLELFGDWSAALFLSGSGITTDPRYNYSSIDLLGDFAPLNVMEATLPISSYESSQKSMGPKFIRLNATSQISYGVTLWTSSGSLNAVIVRLN